MNNSPGITLEYPTVVSGADHNGIRSAVGTGRLTASARNITSPLVLAALTGLGVALAVPVHLAVAHVGLAEGARLLGALSVGSAWVYVFLGLQSGRWTLAVQGLLVAAGVAAAAIWGLGHAPSAMSVVFLAQAAWSLRLVLDRDEPGPDPLVSWFAFNLTLAVLTGIVSAG